MSQITDERRFTRSSQTSTTVTADAVEHAIRHTTLRVSRTTGLPNASDDIGNWTESLGLASMFVEGAVVILAAYAWNLARHERRPGVHASVAPGVNAGR
jgi:hypothetical protein